MDDGWPRSPSYVAGTAVAWAMFLVGVWLMSWGTGAGNLPEALLWVVAIVLAASVAAQFIVAYRLIARQDEFIRAITAKRIIAAAGLTVTAAVLYGLADQFLGAPALPMWLLYPFFWGAFGVATPFIRDARP